MVAKSPKRTIIKLGEKNLKDGGGGGGGERLTREFIGIYAQLMDNDNTVVKA